jgi:hypothetical protein
MRITFPAIRRCIFLVVAATLGGSATARGQIFASCREIQRVAGKTGNPITAGIFERIVSHGPDGIEFVTEFSGTEARDATGRVYSEIRFPPSGQSNSENTSQGPRTETGSFGFRPKSRIDSEVFISDCPSGREVTLFPDLKIAQVMKGRGAFTSQQTRPQITYFESLTARLPSNDVFEDLGRKEIDGIQTHGYRTTVVGTEIDSEWNGRPTSIRECWISDELAVTVLEIRTNLKGKSESRVTRSNIKREEPDSSLFEIPPDYAVNPPSSDVPTLKTRQ